jgi:hypothetical protein
MARRATHTLVFLGASRTDRIDFGPGPDFPVVWQNHKTTLTNEEPEIRLEAILVEGPKVGKSVWVLWEGATAIMLDMSNGVVSGLEKNELNDVLSFEAEPLTGVSAADSAIGGIGQRSTKDLLPDSKRYWVTQIPATLRDKLDEAVTRTGSRLLGITHPGGLPRAHWGERTEAERAIEWRRVEIWDELTFSLHGRTDGTVETRVIRSSPGSEKWAADLPKEGPAFWMGPGPVTRVGPDGQRVTDALTLFDDRGDPIETEKIDLPRDKVPAEWLHAWIEELASTTRRVPVVERFSNVSPDRKFYIAGGVCAALALIVCVAQGEWIGYQTAKTDARAAQLQAMRAQFAAVDNSKQEEAATAALADKLKDQADDLDKQLQKLRDDQTAVDKKEAEISARREQVSYLQKIHRPAIAALLKAVAEVEENSGAQVVVKDIRQATDGSNLVLTGLCRHAPAANAFALWLQERLSDSGWRVGAARKRMRDDMQAFNFTLVLTPKALSNPASTTGSDPASEGKGVTAQTVPPAGTQAAGSAQRINGAAKVPPASGGNHS